MAPMPVIGDPAQFDRRSGNLVERAVFNNRALFVALCALVTALFAWQAYGLRLNASYEKVIPTAHPYIGNYQTYRADLPNLGNTVRIVVENTRGDIFDPAYLKDLQRINDTVYLMPGVDRSWMKSLWMPIVRWREVTETGINGGPVMPADYSGSPESIAKLRQNLARAGVMGSLVANDLKSTMIVVPLLGDDPKTGEQLDYRAFSRALEDKVRALQNDGTRVHIVGFAKLIGDLIDGVAEVMGYFAVSVAIAAVIIFLYNRCIRSTVVVLACSMVAVVWQLGAITALGYSLNPYSVLVPFLVFAIGVSHGAQKMNGIMQDVGRGTHRYVAARFTFRRLFLAGFTALLADVVGFAVLLVIDIPVIKELALMASLGVGMLIMTNLLLLPVILSYSGVGAAAAQRSLREDSKVHESSGKGFWEWLVRFTDRRWAAGTLAAALALTVAGYAVSLNLKIGDLDPGAPELRANSRYNKDNAYITSHYNLSSDQLAVIVVTPVEGCRMFPTLVDIGRLERKLAQLPGVQRVESLAGTTAMITSALFEAGGKWTTISRDQTITDNAMSAAIAVDPSAVNANCSVTPVVAYLSDHKAETLERAIKAVEDFAATHNRDGVSFLPVAGSAGIEAVTNIVVHDANRIMLLYVYAAVLVLCFVTFRSWRAVVVAVVPLVMTSVLCEALMVVLGIGVKVATLPVVALGVGIGVDYALYLLSVQIALQRAGLPLAEAYRRALRFTGRVVGLIGVTLAAGVGVWALSPIKFQADMGILLTFMFLWNMVGALVLIPALSHFLMRGKKERDETARRAAAAKTTKTEGAAVLRSDEASAGAD
ncbi:RND family transporter [Azospirillum sp. INR13]|uniref:efflux RND transporter permease subunit n=1 Tax=Azospirillum sp. INR13 TaxID=2596919 RepID=UPI001B3BA766|nr:MMPL family transporter [Azospirillum sp. INR13]